MMKADEIWKVKDKLKFYMIFWLKNNFEFLSKSLYSIMYSILALGIYLWEISKTW